MHKRRKIEIGIWAINLILILSLWLVFEYSTIVSGSSGLFIALGRLFGLVAVFCILTQLLLIGRVKWIERYFGHDKLVSYHKINGYIAFSSILLHVLFLLTGYSLENGTNAVTQFINFILYYENVAIAAIAVLIFIIVISVTIVRKRMKYETWYYIHLSIYLAILLSFFHQLDIGADFVNHPYFAYYWYILYAFSVGNLLIYRFGMPLYNYRKHQFTVDKVVRENKNVVSVYITGKDIHKFKMKPGQFMILRFLSKKLWYEAHPFSISSTHNGEYIRISVKEVGDFTSKIHSIEKGTKVLIDGPHGIFIEEVAKSKKVALISSGIGITPIYSLLESLKGRKEMILLYGNKTQEDFIFKHNIDTIAKEHNIKVHYFTSQEKHQGFINSRIDENHIKQLIPDFKERDFFICGPAAMTNHLIKELEHIGVKKSMIHFEKFVF